MTKPLNIPARSLPVPDTVSTGMQALIAAPLRAGWNNFPSTPEGWRALAEAGRKAAAPNVAAMAERLGVKVESGTIGGVRVHTVTPAAIAPENRNRTVVQIHGGCYVLNPGEAGLTEALLIAAFGGFKVVAVDYRMPPEAYFPAALDDAVTVWQAVAAGGDPRRIGLIGTSAGGALVLAMGRSFRLMAINWPKPVALGPTYASGVLGAMWTFQYGALLFGIGA